MFTNALQHLRPVNPHLHDTTCCHTGLTTGVTTGWTFVYTIQPVVKPVVQPVVSCKRGIRSLSASGHGIFIDIIYFPLVVVRCVGWLEASCLETKNCVIVCTLVAVDVVCFYGTHRYVDKWTTLSHSIQRNSQGHTFQSPGNIAAPPQEINNIKVSGEAILSTENVENPLCGGQSIALPHGVVRLAVTQTTPLSAP